MGLRQLAQFSDAQPGQGTLGLMGYSGDRGDIPLHRGRLLANRLVAMAQVFALLAEEQNDIARR